MNSVERNTANFYDWEALGGGKKLFPWPVMLEPPFARRKTNHAPHKGADDGQTHTLFSRIFQAFSSPEKFLAEVKEELPVDNSPKPYEGYQLTEPVYELVLSPSPKHTPNLAETEAFLLMAGECQYPLSFEIIILLTGIAFQFAGQKEDIDSLYYQIKSYFPEVTATRRTNYLTHKAWNPTGITAIIELAPQEEFPRPLKLCHSLKPDPLVGILAACERASERMQEGEMGLIQVLFQGVRQPWAGGILEAVSDDNGGPFFSNSPEMLPLAREKTKGPLFAAVIRCVGQGQDGEQAVNILADLVESFVALDNPGSNSLVLLSNEGYPFEAHATNVALRQTNRPGMILGSRELVNLVHLPNPAAVTSKLTQSIRKTKAAPAFALNPKYALGINTHRGQVNLVGLSREKLSRHVHMLGSTGKGKSVLLLNLAIQCIMNGFGGAIIDPHGDLVEDIISQIPPEKLDNVIVLDPTNPDFSIGLNLLNANSEPEKIQLSSDMAASLTQQATNVGPQMDITLQNAIMTILESEKEGSLLDLWHFLKDEKVRNEFLKSVHDPILMSFWEDEFQRITKATMSSLLNRLQMFLRPKPLRYMLMQKEGLDFRKVMDDRKVVLIKLSQGLLGEENSYSLGSLILTKLYQAALSRQAISRKDRHMFMVAIDEFQNFVTPTLEGILSGARKYGLGLVLAHQNLDQIMRRSASVGNSLLANAGTRICFGVGDADATKFASGFSGFEAHDLVSLDIGEAVVRIGGRQHDFSLSTQLPEDVPEDEAQRRHQFVIEESGRKHGVPIQILEEELRSLKVDSKPTKPAKPEDTRDQKAKDQPSSEPPKSPETKQEEVEKPTVKVVEEIASVEDLAAAKEAFLRANRRKTEHTEHQYLQTLIKKMAEAKGFKATIEKPTPDGHGRVDVALDNGKIKIACEVSVTTTPEHELGNIQKCLKAGYDHVVACSKRPKHLAKIKNLAAEVLDQKASMKVHFFQPEALFAFLDQFIAQQASSEKRIKGYRVKTKYDPVAPADGKQKYEDISKALLDSLNREKKPKDKQ